MVEATVVVEDVAAGKHAIHVEAMGTCPETALKARNVTIV